MIDKIKKFCELDRSDILYVKYGYEDYEEIVEKLDIKDDCMYIHTKGRQYPYTMKHYISKKESCVCIEGGLIISTYKEKRFEREYDR